MSAEEEEENRQLQEEERLALEAIYGPDVIKPDDASPNSYVVTVNVDQDETELRSPRVMVLRFFLPSTYPSRDPPVYEISSVYCGPRRIESNMLDVIEREFETLFQPGQVVLFEWISWLRDYIEMEIEKEEPGNEQQHPQVPPGEEEDREQSEEYQLSPASVDTSDQPKVKDCSVDIINEPVPEIYSSPEPLVDRRSVFVAHVAEVHSPSQVRAVIAKLLENKKVAKATHNIMAYRIEMEDGRMLQDNDDDGETAAGGRLLHLLQIVDVKNVVVVVSRWFGGILLGADRFKDINNCARKALEDCGYIKDPSSESKAKGKRKK